MRRAGPASVVNQVEGSAFPEMARPDAGRTSGAAIFWSYTSRPVYRLVLDHVEGADLAAGDVALLDDSSSRFGAKQSTSGSPPAATFFRPLAQRAGAPVPREPGQIDAVASPSATSSGLCHDRLRHRSRAEFV